MSLLLKTKKTIKIYIYKNIRKGEKKTRRKKFAICETPTRKTFEKRNKEASTKKKSRLIVTTLSKTHT